MKFKHKVGFIVEGYRDELALRNAFKDIEVCKLFGTRFDAKTKAKIHKIIKSCDVVFLLSDPDEPGDIIARKITEEFKELIRIRVDPNRARNLTNKGWKYGVEYCSRKYLREIVGKAYQKWSKSKITL